MSEAKILDEASQDETVAPLQYDTTSFGADYDVDGLVRRIQRGDIFIPDFQRDYVWNQKEASRFIESLLLGLPVPGIFLAREPESNRMLVIDGQQRLKTLQFFYEGFFHPKPNEATKKVFSLIRVQPHLEGLTYAALSESNRIKINDSIIHATIVKQESPADDNTSVFHVFERLNTGGRKLVPQQIRTAIYHGPLIDLIKKLNDLTSWRSIYGPKSNLLKDHELILRFFALFYASDSYKSPMAEFLNIFAKKHKRASGEFLARSEELFVVCVELVRREIGDKAFRLERAFNAAVFDSVMVGLARRFERKSSVVDGAVRSVYRKLLDDDRFISAVSKATSNERTVAARLKLATDYFSALR